MRRFVQGGWVLDCLWLLAWGAASSAWCLGAGARLGATFDEPVYVNCGLDYWRTGSHAPLMRLGTMPLPVDVTTLPLYLLERWRGAPIDPGTELDTLLPLARAGTLVFWWLLLIYGLRAGRRLAGPWGGRLAVALLAFEPCLLAHASLATTDIAASACLLALVYHFRTARAPGSGAGWWGRVGLPAFWFGAAVLAKASGLLFGPLCLLAVELERVFRARLPRGGSGALAWPRTLWEDLRPFRRDLPRIMSLGLVLVFVYCGSDWQPEGSFVQWTHGLPPGPAGASLVWLAEHLRVFSNAGVGLVKQITHNCRGHGVYLLGETAPRALWYYFPVALTIKLSVPLLLAPVLLALWRPRSLCNWACVAVAALLAFSITYRVQIGIRLVLPLVVLGIVGLAAALVNAGRQSTSAWARATLAVLLVGAVAWTTRAALVVWPHALCYTNPLWGGTGHGYLYLSDSNYDWGQGLKELASFEERQGINPLEVWYLGADPEVRKLPMQPVFLQDLPVTTTADVKAYLQGHYLAASTTLLYGAFGNTEAHRLAAEFLRSCQPVARTQTYLIYDFTRASPSGTH